MSVEPVAVEQDYRREERREHKAMESKLPGAKFNANTLSRAFDDNCSVGSVKSQKPLPAALFFQFLPSSCDLGLPLIGFIRITETLRKN